MTEPAFDNSKCGFEFVEAIEVFEFISDCEIIDAPDAVSECIPTVVLPIEPIVPPESGTAGPEGPEGPTGPVGPAGAIGPTPLVYYGTTTTVIGWVIASVGISWDYVFEDDYFYLLWTFTLGVPDYPQRCCVWRANQAGSGGTWRLMDSMGDCTCGDDVDLDVVSSGANACTPSTSDVTCLGDIAVICTE